MESAPDEFTRSRGKCCIDFQNHHIDTSSAPSPPSALSISSTRPSSRTDRRIRFADIKPDDVHVYESAPTSPKRKPLALLSPTDAPDFNDSTTSVSLGKWKGALPPSDSPPVDSKDATDVEPEEGTPEYIRRRFFPNAPFRDPNLAWMELSSTPESSDTANNSSLRFDLTGTPIPASVSTTLPTHLGLHHHAEGTHAGYTLDDLFLLSRSSVPAQRTTMLDVLGRIARKLGQGRKAQQGRIEELLGQEEDLRKRIVAAGIEAMGERGSLGARAVEVIWECIVRWDEEFADLEGIELRIGGGDGEGNSDLIASLPLEYVLGQISISLSQAALPSHSLSQLLAILHRLAQHTNTIASAIIATPNLIANVVQTFLLTSYPPTENSSMPNPAALQFLVTLTLASRPNASALTEPADSLLRFITVLPSASPYPAPLATSLLVSTLRLYTAFASYGLYSHIATTAATYFAQLGRYVLSEACTSKALMEAWAGLLEAWIVCATDPHRTVPDHDILWSQVVGWDWGIDVLELIHKLETTEADWPVWAAVWRAEGAWLEGARINGVKAGEKERQISIEVLKDGFEGGNEKAVIEGAVDMMEVKLLEFSSSDSPSSVTERLRILAVHAYTVQALLRLWLSLVPTSGGPLASPPFTVPFQRLSELSAKLVSHPLWLSLQSDSAPPYVHLFLRPLTSLLRSYLHLSHHLPGVPQDLWMAQALSVLCRLIPGDEEFGQEIVEEVTSLINPDLIASRGWSVPNVIWTKGGMEPIMPFLQHTIRPSTDTYIGPNCITPQSIAASTTQRLPSSLTRNSGPSRSFGLPLTRDWTTSPLDHLLRSATSSVFKSLPSAWDSTETEIVRSSLVLTKVVREVLSRYALNDFVIGRDETVFACMKLFMLEHDQPQNDSNEEVFRDSIVERLMDDLLSPFTKPSTRVSPYPTKPSSNVSDLEKVAIRFLGPSTPFFQYYTDFVALFDSVSFSQPLFARLLLPPTSMRYAADYRKHLWGDFGHVLRTIRTPFDQVIAEDFCEYLWPVENDAPMLASYLQVLIKGPLEGFVRLTAVHHIACNIWPDLDREGHDTQRAGKLLKAITEQGDGLVVREVLRYRQKDQGSLVLPPACYEQTGEWVSARIELIGHHLGVNVKNSLGSLLEDFSA